MDPGTMATLSHCMHGPLTTEEVVDDGVGGTVGVDQPVREGKAGVDGFPVTGLAEHPEHSSANGEDSEEQDRWAGKGAHRTLARKCRGPHCSLLPIWVTWFEVLTAILGT